MVNAGQTFTKIPQILTIADAFDTSIGTLPLKGGAPSKDTAAEVFFTRERSNESARPVVRYDRH